MKSNFDKTIALSKKIAKALLRDKTPKSLDGSELFDQSDKDYILDQLTKEDNINRRAAIVKTIDETANWESLKTKIDVPVRKFYRKYVTAASVLLMLIVAITLFLNDEDKIQPAHPIIDNVIIKPGTDKATLTLEDGNQIELEKGQSFKTQNANSNGKKIVYGSGKSNKSSKKDIVYNYLTTPIGGEFFVELSDGTQVWLNSVSQLKYPVNFIDGKTRQVELVYGEAYFDVSPSALHKGSKFKVLNKSQEIEVLGTEFNVKAYKGETSIYTTLVEGKVAVNIDSTKQSLIPNQQLDLNINTGITKIKSVDVYREVSWKNGVFSFKNKPLKEIMKVLSRWYDVEVVFKNKTIEAIIFNGTLKKKLGMVDIMKTITNTNNIDYELIDKMIILK